MTMNLDEIHSKIHDLVKLENQCACLFDAVKQGNGSKSFNYLTLRDSCKELRKGIFKGAISAGLTREKIKTEIENAKREIPPPTSQEGTK